MLSPRPSPALSRSSSRAPACAARSCRSRLVGARRALERRQRRRPTPSSTATSALPETFHLAEVFEPRFSPFVAVSAAIAVIPPIVYWVRVGTSVKKRLDAEERERQEAEEKELERLERLRRLRGE